MGSGTPRMRHAILLLLLILGIFLRVYHLGEESIWYDEALTIDKAKLPFPEMFEAVVWNDVNPPLYYIVLQVWISLFGDSEISVRFPSMIFGLLAMVMIYQVGTLLYDRDVGLLSLLLLAVSLFHLQYSQETRMYSLMAFLSLLSMYYFLKLQKSQQAVVAAGYIVSSALLLYTHVYGGFIILGQNIYILTMLILDRERHTLSFKKWVFSQLLVILLFSPWIGIFASKVIWVHSQSEFWIKETSLRGMLSIFKTYSGSRFSFLVSVLLIFFALFRLTKTDGKLLRGDFFQSLETCQWQVRFSDAGKNYFLIIWLLTSILVPFFLSKLSQPVYMIRYTIGASLAWYILIAKGITNIRGSATIKSVFIALIVVMSLITVHKYYRSTVKVNWREIVKVVEEKSQAGDLVLINSRALVWPYNYYSTRDDLVKQVFPPIYAPDKIRLDQSDVKKLDRLSKNYKNIWLITSKERDREGLIRSTLSKSHNLVYENKYHYALIYLYKR